MGSLSSHRIIGLNLTGAKNLKTALVSLQVYLKEEKTFVVDVYDRIALKENQSPDEALLELIDEIQGEGNEKTLLCTDVPIELPPCLTHAHPCKDPRAKWMKTFIKKKQEMALITPYTQRPIELWVKYQELPKLPEWLRFEIDEALGGNKAPLTARMLYLKPSIVKKMDLFEAWPKLTLAKVAHKLSLSKRSFQSYRKLEEGYRAREEILRALSLKENIFIYERDTQKLMENLSSFDAFLCALSGLFYIQGRVVPKPQKPKDYPQKSEWLLIPENRSS